MSDKSLIETIDRAPEEVNEISIDNLLFSTICEVSGEPDRWNLSISYVPIGRLLEIVSVREYLNSYQDDRMIVAEAGAQITRDLHDVVEPRQIVVEAKVVPTSSPEQTVMWTI